MQPRIAIIYFSSSGVIAQIAAYLAEGATARGAEVRVRALEAPGGSTGPGSPAPDRAPAAPPTLADLDWADGLLIGTPTWFGNIAAPLKAFLDTTSPLALHGRLADKPVTGFTSASLPNGGQEAALLALYHTMFHWGSLIVPTGYTHPVLRRIGGNPYGLSLTAPDAGRLTDDQIEAARFVGDRIARTAERYVPAGLPSAHDLWTSQAPGDAAGALAAADSRHA
ncbi:flavodoxin family protein [Streptomyces yaizuensis]|uniref:NAD(P)H-dependent oxidoreductase n=1 Tax=Streptomyces yaizuensis TaxID=2989713 RepID=A0ABQ5NYP8_9ACTN|nr:NAD(P)H-dependent oxidoreductase [Streptomyces sp. YSPA8]GLF95492.1 NAD(P)H-dependent oxidoreductase [Streptomyces sp. YSPA8]